MDSSQFPKYFSLLPEPEKAGYIRLRNDLVGITKMPAKMRSPEPFLNVLYRIRCFCLRNDENDWKRCLVCGVCWLKEGIATNTRTLKILLNKCKSSINGSLLKMGYITHHTRNDLTAQLSSAIPILRDNFSEMREWAIRIKKEGRPSSLPLPKIMIPPRSVTPKAMFPQAVGKMYVQPILSKRPMLSFTPYFVVPDVDLFSIVSDGETIESSDILTSMNVDKAIDSFCHFGENDLFDL